MTEYSRIMQLVEETQQRIDQIKAEVQRLQPTGADQQSAMGQQPPASEDAGVHIIPGARSGAGEPIVGGFPTRDFPDCAAIGSELGYFCSGTLIAPNLVVTARHCRGVTRVFLDGYDTDSPETGETIAVIREYAHPIADLRVLVLEHDSRVRPRHIAQSIEIQATHATLVGFGHINFNGTVGYGLKRMVEDVPIMSLGCSSVSDVDEYDCRQEIEMVAGHRGLGKDSCRGDSGGPLYIKSPEGVYYLLGATSRGIAAAPRVCGDGGIYVRVDQFIEWIQEQTGVMIEGPRI